MAINHLIEQGDVDRLFTLAKNEKYPDVLYYMLQTLRESDPQRAKIVAVRLLERTDKVPMIYAGLLAIAEVDIDEAMHWVTHFKDNNSEALFVARVSIAAREEQAMSLDDFLTEKATHLSEEYLDEFVASLAKFLSSQPEAVQQRGLDTIDSSFFINTDNPEYGRFYLITGLLRQYVQEEDVDYQDKLLRTINSLYQKETNEYLRGVLKEGLGDLLD
jgi:hypothetical protein